MKQALRILVGLLCSAVIVASQTVEPPASRSVQVHPLAVGGVPPKGSIGNSDVRTSVREQKGSIADRSMSLAVSEDVPSGSGKMMRSALWVAAATAGRVMGDPLLDREITVSLKGRIDGPSAGALFTVAMLANMQGDTIVPDVTMTGTILPDGGVGVVGGIRYKLDAAKEGKMRKVLLPEYMRIETDIETGAIIDLAEYGKQLGLEVVFVSSIGEAYRELTGKQLKMPARKTPPNRKVTLPETMNTIIRKRVSERYSATQALLKDLQENMNLPAFQKLTAVQQQFVAQQVDGKMSEMSTLSMLGMASMQEGNWVTAYDRLTTAWLGLEALRSWRDAGYALQTKDAYDKAMELVLNRAYWLNETAGTNQNMVTRALLLARNQHGFMSTFTTDLEWGIYAQEHETVADEHAKKAKGFFETLVGSKEEDAILANQAALQAHFTYQTHRFKTAEVHIKPESLPRGMVDPDILSEAMTFRSTDTRSAPKPLDPDRTAQWNAFVSKRYEAVLEGLFAIIETMSEEDREFVMQDPGIRRATALSDYWANMQQGEEPAADKTEKKPTPEDLFTQSAFLLAEESQVMAAITQNELGIYMINGEYGNVGAARAGALKGMLSRAEENARQAILAAEQIGYIAVGSRYDYLLAEGIRNGNVADQLKALRLYWSASALCQLVELCTVQ